MQSLISIHLMQEGVAPINLIVEHELHRATPGGTGGVKTIGNYAAVSCYSCPFLIALIFSRLFLAYCLFVTWYYGPGIIFQLQVLEL